MATGSLNNFNEQFLRPVKDAEIIAYPDVDIKRDKQSHKSISFALWLRTARQLNRQGWNIQVSNILEDTVNTAQRMDKIDIADLAFEHAKEKFIQQLKHSCVIPLELEAHVHEKNGKMEK
jgi:hypothetical protein